MSSWDTDVANACDKICACVDASSTRIFYDVPYRTLVQSRIEPVDPAFLFALEVSQRVKKCPSVYKVDTYTIEPLINNNFRVWFCLKLSQLTDLM